MTLNTQDKMRPILGTMPTTVLIDRDGRVRHIHPGYLAGYEDIYDQEIRGLLK